jgi:hypothetical protein
MPLYTCLHNLPNVLEQIANKIGLQITYNRISIPMATSAHAPLLATLAPLTEG